MQKLTRTFTQKRIIEQMRVDELASNEILLYGRKDGELALEKRLLGSIGCSG